MCDTGVCAWRNSDAQLVSTFSWIIDVRLARRGKRRVGKKGEGRQRCFWSQKYHLASTGYNSILARKGYIHTSPSPLIAQHPVKPYVWTYHVHAYIYLCLLAYVGTSLRILFANKCIKKVEYQLYNQSNSRLTYFIPRQFIKYKYLIPQTDGKRGTRRKEY